MGGRVAVVPRLSWFRRCIRSRVPRDRRRRRGSASKCSARVTAQQRCTEAIARHKFVHSVSRSVRRSEHLRSFDRIRSGIPLLWDLPTSSCSPACLALSPRPPMLVRGGQRTLPPTVSLRPSETRNLAARETPTDIILYYLTTSRCAAVRREHAHTHGDPGRARYRRTRRVI